MFEQSIRILDSYIRYSEKNNYLILTFKNKCKLCHFFCLKYFFSQSTYQKQLGN